MRGNPETMTFLETTTLHTAQKEAVMTLWNKEYPTTLALTTVADFDGYLQNLTNHHHLLVIDDQNRTVGWFFTFERDAEQWFAMLLDSDVQGQRLGSQLLSRAKLKHDTLNGWVIDHDNYKKSNGQPYRSPVAFYLKNEFEQLNLTRLETPKLSAVKMRWKSEV